MKDQPSEMFLGACPAGHGQSRMRQTGDGLWYVECPWCDYRGWAYDTQEQAATAWNAIRDYGRARLLADWWLRAHGLPPPRRYETRKERRGERDHD